MGIYPTEDVTPELLASLGLEPEDLGEETVQTFQAYDSYGNLYQDARVENGQVVDGSGTVIEGAYIDSGRNRLRRIRESRIFRGSGRSDRPESRKSGDCPSAGGKQRRVRAGTVWDGTATDDGTAAEDTVSE